ncbi:MAG: nucleotidyltransferase family protein [Candidatus Eremiobacteraeota bacterium]|nr:nucleotidyltransferase family protein [Candidatus Eremiobacteraeota bacterium]MCW5869099.1 nucleotidyltransferase family protein [Candidatus Eremiobacteraeota bacterium]
MRTLVLAAGKSTRIASVSGGAPKPTLELAGQSVLRHNLDWLRQSGIESVDVNLHHQPERIRASLADYPMLFRFWEEMELQGTAGSYRNLRSEERVLVVYGDNLIRFDLAKFREQHCTPVSIALFDPACVPNTGIAGGRVKLDSRGQVIRFEEGGQEGLVNAGVYLLEPSIQEWIPDEAPYDFARDLFPRLLQQGVEMRGFELDGYCLGLDTPESWARAQNLIDSGKVRIA